MTEDTIWKIATVSVGFLTGFGGVLFKKKLDTIKEHEAQEVSMQKQILELQTAFNSHVADNSSRFEAAEKRFDHQWQFIEKRFDRVDDKIEKLTEMLLEDKKEK